MVSDELIKITRCLETGSPLHRATKELRQQVNVAIEQGRLHNRLGRKLSQKIDDGLVNAEETFLYPVLDDVPQLLRDEAIPLQQLDSENINSDS